MLKRADRLAGVLDAVAGAALGGDAADQVEDQVLGRHAAGQPAVDADLQRLGLVLQQRLRGQHVLDLAGADAEGQRPERPVRGRVAVAADDRHARLGQAQLRPDHVDDALVLVVQVVEADAELRGSCRGACRSAAWRSGRRSAASGRWWARCGRRWPRSARAGATLRPARRRPSNAWGLVTSWTRCRSM